METLASLCDFIDSGKPIRARLNDDGIPGYEIGHILNNEIKETPIKVASDSDKILLRGDIVTGRVGGIGVFAEYQSEQPASFSDNVLRIRLRESQRQRAAFITEFLNSDIGGAQVIRGSRGSLQRVVTQQSLGAVLIPEFGERETEIARVLADARAERKAKLAEADALLAGIDDFLLSELGIAPPEADGRRVFAARLGDLAEKSLSPSHHAPVLRNFIAALRNHPAADKPLSAYAEINPSDGVAGLDSDAIVGFVPMQAVSDGATGEYAAAERPLREVRQGYTQFADSDILWAKITPCMENGKVCIVDGLPNGVGFGSTEFHVLRATEEIALAEFVKEFVSQASLRRVAVHSFTGSAGQQRVPASFLASLPFPAVSIERQREIVASVRAARERARRLRGEAEAGWVAARAGFEEGLLG